MRIRLEQVDKLNTTKGPRTMLIMEVISGNVEGFSPNQEFEILVEGTDFVRDSDGRVIKPWEEKKNG